MEIMPILEQKIAHKMTTLCSHMTYPELVLPLHKHAEYQLIILPTAAESSSWERALRLMQKVMLR